MRISNRQLVCRYVHPSFTCNRYAAGAIEGGIAIDYTESALEAAVRFARIAPSVKE